MKMRRREFLAAAAAGVAGAWIGKPAWAAEAANPTAVVPLGKTLKACRISCGTGMSGGNRQSNQTRMGQEKFEALLHHSLDKGVRQFDLADLYGTHPFVGRVVKDQPRDTVQLVSKIWTRPGGIPEEEREPADVLVKRFLDELQTDYLDVLQIHCVTEADWNVKERAQMDRMEQLKQDGLIRAHGVSCHSLEALKTAAAEPWVDLVHARVNPFAYRTDAPMEEVVPVLQAIHAAGKGIIGMKLIGEGTFDPEKRKETLKFVMGLGCVDCMTVGFENPEQIDEFVAAVAGELASGTASASQAA